jgi:hypothetical protein
VHCSLAESLTGKRFLGLSSPPDVDHSLQMLAEVLLRGQGHFFT